MLLDTLAKRYGTDKSSAKHGYADLYERYFEPWRNRSINLLEIGVKRGASLAMWREYFLKGTIYGIDRNKDCLEYQRDRIQIFIGQQEDERFLSAIVPQMKTLWIVIDDGGHKMHEQQASFNFLFPHLRPGGIYVIEDIHTSYWKKWGGGYRKENSTIEKIKGFIDDFHFRFHKQERSEISPMIASIHVYPQIVFIFRKDNV